MRPKKALSVLAAGVLALSLAGFGYSEEGPPNPMNDECIEPFHDLIAAVCLDSPEPILGLFGSWKNVPINFGSDAYEVSRVSHTIGFHVSGSVGHLVTGLEADPDPYDGVSAAYAPFWEEAWLGGRNYLAISPTRTDEPEPDGTNNTYILMRDHSESQWDVIYNFNRVGTTTQMRESPETSAQANFRIGNPALTEVGEIENRIQYMGGNQYWMRFPTDAANLVMSDPPCGSEDANSDFCMDSELVTSSGDPEELVHWRVGRSASAATPDQTPGAFDESDLGFVNGVDQNLLSECLESSPDLCMSTVPGLAECVGTHDVCNTLPGYRVDDIRAHDVGSDSISEFEAAEALTNRFDLDGESLELGLTDVEDYEGRYDVPLPSAWSANHQIWVASTEELVSADDETSYEGLISAIDATTGQLIHTCMGTSC